MNIFRDHFCWLVFVISIAVIFFAITLVFSEYDLVIARALWPIDNNILWQKIIDKIVITSSWVGGFTILAILLYSFRYRHLLLQRPMIFLLLSLLIGPGFLMNYLKDEVSRPRPKQLIEFGGKLNYVPALNYYNECPKKCRSFPSGHAAGAFWWSALAWIFAKRYRARIRTIALAIGITTSVARMLQGAHFLSDVIFAFVLVELVHFFCAAVVLQKATLFKHAETHEPCV